MNEDQSAENRIATDLDRLRGIAQAEPKPYFFNRVEGRLARRRSGLVGRPGWVFRPAVMAGSLGLLALLNGTVALYAIQHGRAERRLQPDGATAALAAELGVDVLTINW